MSKDAHTLGSAPIEPQYRERMNELARAIDEFFNGDEKPKRNGFVLMVFPFADFDGRCNYISNADRRDIITLLKEQTRYFEGAPDNVKGKA